MKKTIIILILLMVLTGCVQTSQNSKRSKEALTDFFSDSKNKTFVRDIQVSYDSYGEDLALGGILGYTTDLNGKIIVKNSKNLDGYFLLEVSVLNSETMKFARFYQISEVQGEPFVTEGIKASNDKYYEYAKEPKNYLDRKFEFFQTENGTKYLFEISPYDDNFVSSFYMFDEDTDHLLDIHIKSEIYRSFLDLDKIMGTSTLLVEKSYFQDVLNNTASSFSRQLSEQIILNRDESSKEDYIIDYSVGIIRYKLSGVNNTLEDWKSYFDDFPIKEVK